MKYYRYQRRRIFATNATSYLSYSFDAPSSAHTEGKNPPSAVPTPGYPKFLGQRDLTSTVDAWREGYTPVTIRDITWRTPDREFEIFGDLPLDHSTLVLPDSLAGRCKTKLLSNIYTAQAGWQGGVFVGELRETIKLIRAPQKSLFRAFMDLPREYKYLRNRYGRGSRRFMASWSKFYLEFTYGVQPLISDIEASVDRFNQIQDKVVTKLVKAHVDSQSEEILAPVTIYDNGSILLVMEDRIQKEAFASGAALILAFPLGAKHNLNNYGMRPRDFVPTLYELIPFSFVVDYFTNLNDIVNSQFVERHGIIYSWVSSKETCRAVRLPIVQKSPNGTGNVDVGPGVRYKTVTRRQKEADIDLSFYVEKPSLKQWVNLGALTHALSQIK